MRTLSILALIFSFTIGNLALSTEAISFKPDPVVTVELDEGSRPWGAYICGAIGFVVLYTAASMKLRLLQQVNRTLFGFLLRPRPGL